MWATKLDPGAILFSCLSADFPGPAYYITSRWQVATYVKSREGESIWNSDAWNVDRIETENRGVPVAVITFENGRTRKSRLIFCADPTRLPSN